MASMNLDQQIKERIQSFVSQLTYLVKQSAVESVKNALGGGAVRKGAARAKQETEGGDTASRGRSAGKKGRRGRKGAKRSRRQLVNISGKLLEQIKSNPGQRIEQVAAALNMGTRQLALPVKKLIAEKKISKKGEKRATTYFAR